MRAELPKLFCRYVDTSCRADEGTWSCACHCGSCAVRDVMKLRNAGLPKREPVSRGGLAASTCSASSSTERMPLHVASSVETTEIGVLRTESEMPKTKARMSVYVGDARKSSWSRGDSMRRMGIAKVGFVGGSGSAGVSGAGSVGAVADGFRTRGISFGSFCCASGGSRASEVVMTALFGVEGGLKMRPRESCKQIAGKMQPSSCRSGSARRRIRGPERACAS